MILKIQYANLKKVNIIKIGKTLTLETKFEKRTVDLSISVKSATFLGQTVLYNLYKIFYFIK